MTIQQRAIDAIGRLPEDKIIQVIRFAEFLSLEPDTNIQKTHHEASGEDGYIRKPGILKRKMVMADDFDETPE